MVFWLAAETTHLILTFSFFDVCFTWKEKGVWFQPESQVFHYIQRFQQVSLVWYFWQVFNKNAYSDLEYHNKLISMDFVVWEYSNWENVCVCGMVGASRSSILKGIGDLKGIKCNCVGDRFDYFQTFWRDRFLEALVIAMSIKHILIFIPYWDFVTEDYILL